MDIDFGTSPHLGSAYASTCLFQLVLIDRRPTDELRPSPGDPWLFEAPRLHAGDGDMRAGAVYDRSRMAVGSRRLALYIEESVLTNTSSDRRLDASHQRQPQ